MKRLLILSLVAASASVFAVDYTGPGGDIPDFSGSTPGSATFTINIGTGITSVQSITLTGLVHTWVGDLIATVTNPSGASINLFQRIGSTTSTGVGDSSDFGSTYRFINGGANIWDAATAQTGTGVIPGGDYEASSRDSVTFAYLPQSISTLNGSIAGDWTLTISDNAGGDVGTFSEWTISATPVPEPASMAALGLGALALLRRRRK